MKVEITGPARTDLREIAAYIAQDNARRARSFSAELRDKALAIGTRRMDFPSSAHTIRTTYAIGPFGTMLSFTG